MTPFLVKLDEHLGKATRQLLREGSYDVDTVLDERLSGSTDDLLWSRVVADGRLLITLDLDFSDVRRFRPGTHPWDFLDSRPQHQQPRRHRARLTLPMLTSISA